MNVVVVSGNICTEPHFWLSRQSKPMLSFVLAARRDPGRPQKRQRESDFLPVVLSGKAAEQLRPLLQVRTRLAVRGFVQSRNYTKRRADGSQTRHTTLEILAERVELLANADWDALARGAPDDRRIRSWDDASRSDAAELDEWSTNIGPVKLPEGVVA